MKSKVSPAVRALLEELRGDDPASLLPAIDAAADALRKASTRRSEGLQLAAALGKLSGHDSWRVRKGVAHASTHFPGRKVFESVLARLVEDPNPYVVEAAEQSRGQRARSSLPDTLNERHAEILARDLADIEERFGAGARQAAERAAYRLSSYVVQEARHELMRVITALDAGLGRLRRAVEAGKLSAATAAEQLGKTSERVSHLTRIIDGLRELTREVRLDLRPHDLLPLIEEAVQLVREQEPDADVHLVETNPVTATVDRDRLLQALTNILKNACESYRGSRHAPRVEVEVRSGSGDAVIEVRDRGCGMTEEAAAMVYRWFGSNKPGATGIGLPLAKKIVVLEHGGEITVKSRRGKGTRVTIRIPMAREVE